MNAECEIGFVSLSLHSQGIVKCEIKCLRHAIITRYASVNYLRPAKALITPIGALITNTMCLRYGKEHTKIAKKLNISNTK